MFIQPQNLLSQHDYANNIKIVESFQNLWRKQNGETCGDYEDSIKEYINEHCQNTNFCQVLIKCALINKVFSTRISSANLIKIANHIVSKKDFDQNLREGNLDAVKIIRKATGTKDNFSFATKYCALHQNKYYPIFDSLSVETLWTYQNSSAFSDKITELTLEDFKKNLRRSDGYARYIKIYKDFMASFGLNNYDYRQVDKYLWTVAKIQ